MRLINLKWISNKKQIKNAFKQPHPKKDPLPHHQTKNPKRRKSHIFMYCFFHTRFAYPPSLWKPYKYHYPLHITYPIPLPIFKTFSNFLAFTWALPWRLLVLILRKLMWRENNTRRRWRQNWKLMITKSNIMILKPPPPLLLRVVAFPWKYSRKSIQKPLLRHRIPPWHAVE